MSACNLELVEAAVLAPSSCMFCRCTPVDDTKADKPPLPFVHAVGMDVNWGEAVYICWLCADVIAELVGRPDKQKVDRVFKAAKAHKERNEELVTAASEMRTVLSEMVEGVEVTERAKELVGDGS